MLMCIGLSVTLCAAFLLNPIVSVVLCQTRV